jgi:deaminated glutathione amidase
VIVVATCQFPVCGRADSNLRWVTRQMAEAARRGATVVHFPECALSGYAGSDLPSYDGYDWAGLRAAADLAMQRAGELGIWLILGAAHPLSAPHKPHDSV